MVLIISMFESRKFSVNCCWLNYWSLPIFTGNSIPLLTPWPCWHWHWSFRIIDHPSSSNFTKNWPSSHQFIIDHPVNHYIHYSTPIIPSMNHWTDGFLYCAVRVELWISLLRPAALLPCLWSSQLGNQKILIFQTTVAECLLNEIAGVLVSGISPQIRK